MSLSHIDEKGNVKMVNIIHKNKSFRRAKFFGAIKMAPETIRMIKKNKIKKGNVLNTARIAGIMAAKQTEKLIPLCHSLKAENIQLEFNLKKDSIEALSLVETTYKTGVEIEASVSVTIALLTIYDMCKAIDRSMEITGIKLIEKTGGKTIFYRTSVIGINVSKKKGVSKKPVNKVELVKNYGVKGDAHFEKGSRRQVSLLSTFSIDKMKKKGLKIKNGDFGENLIIRDVPLVNLPPGTKIKCHEGVLEITRIGKECNNQCWIYKKIGDCVMPTEGVFARVIKGGVLKTEEEIIIEYED